MSNNNQPAFRAFSVHERAGKDIFVEIGAAWSHCNGGYTLRLNALPLGDTVILRPVQEDHQPVPE